MPGGHEKIQGVTKITLRGWGIRGIPKGNNNTEAFSLAISLAVTIAVSLKY